MFRRLFMKKHILVQDGDNRIDACGDTLLKNRLHSFVKNGMEIRGVQIFHYAGIHYRTRHDSYPLRFLNALINSASSISERNNYFCLNNREEPELKRDSSEVIGIGLANMFMCKWYGININRIEKIEGTGKRCDYRFPYNNQIIIFESKGRADSSQLARALKDCMEKKVNHVANYKYSTISHMPRNESPTTLYLYDPPVEENNDPVDEKYIVLKHYARVSELSGLTVISEAIRRRLMQYKTNGEWDTRPLELGNLIKIGALFTINTNSYWTRRNKPIPNNKTEGAYIQFGLHKRVINYLTNWDIENLLKFNVEDNVFEDIGVSILSDGSFFYIGNQSLSNLG